MPVINRVGTVDWFGQSVFTLADYQQSLGEQEERLNDDAFDYASSGGHDRQVNNRLSTAGKIRKQLESGLLGLTVKVTLNSPLPRNQVPYFQIEERDSYTWDYTSGVHIDPERYTHQVYALITGLMKHTAETVSVEMPKSNPRVVILTFYSKEDINRPTNYLLALANKMAKWVTPKQVVILDSYAREKVERTIADLELALATARNFMGMVAYCEEQGIEPTSDVRKVVTEMEKLRYPNAPAGPDNDIWKVCGLFQRGQTAVHAAGTAPQQAEMISGCKREWKED